MKLNFSHHPWKCEVLLNDPSLYSSLENFQKIAGPDIFDVLLRLRHKVRRGWTARGYPRHLAESVFIHTLKTAYAASLLSSHWPKNIQKKFIKMLLIHDLPEVIAPDVIPTDNIPREQKAMTERSVFLEFVRLNPAAFQEALDLWEEFEAQSSVEAQLAFQLDKLDATVQAIRYERQGYPTTDFYPWTLKRLKDDHLIQVFEQVMKTRESGEDPYVVYFRSLKQKN